MAHDLDLHARNYDGDRILLTWGRAHDVIVERSTQRGGDYETIDQVSRSTQFIDVPPGRRNSRDELYYRIRPADFSVTDEHGDLILDENGDPIQSTVDKSTLPIIGPEKAEPEVGYRVAYIRQQEHRHLRRVGEKMHLFEERQGKRCPDCWDDVRRVRKRSECDTCGGNGYIEGWSSPLEFRACIGAGEPEPKETQGGDISTLQLKAWTGAIPEVDVGDHVVRDRDREVFRVVKRRPTKKEAHDLRQNLILKLIERGSEARSVAEQVP